MREKSLIHLYLQHLKTHSFTEDVHQCEIIPYLQSLHDDLSSHIAKSSSSTSIFRKLSRLSSNNRNNTTQVKGIYLWGSVGCGKTFLLDLLFRSISIKAKKKLHFHSFMHDIHTRLANIKEQKNPLATVANEISKQTKLLYLDEFYVSDIGDAMIFSELFRELFARNIVMLISSNCATSELYKNGLQRQRFLPAITLLEEKMQVLQLASTCDYRLQLLKREGLYNYPNNIQAHNEMETTFYRLTADTVSQDLTIQINHRALQTILCSSTVIWLHFKEICHQPRSSEDYLKIAQHYQAVFVSAIPIFNNMDDLARRFINMIDCFYNNNVILICSADEIPEQLYQQGNLHREFQRTKSRLLEMQSDTYLAKGHIIQPDPKTDYEKTH